MTFPAGRTAQRLGQKLWSDSMRSMAIRTYGGLSVALREKTGMDAALMLLVLIRVTPFTYPRKRNRQLALVLELPERMGGLRVFAVTIGTLMAAVYGPPESLFVDCEREGFPVY